MTHVVIGAGEVGQAIAEVLSDTYQVHLRDVEPSGPPEAEVIHICFPYFKGFEEAVAEYAVRYGDPLIIIHSTVPIGTSDSLRATHSPVRGRHPYLAEGVRTFTKYFGGERAQEAADIFASVGIKSEVVPSARDTEAGKLWELAQYGIAIAVEKEVHRYCELHQLDFNTVYTDFAQTYNDGYSALGDTQFVRPVLRHIPGLIGGHCVRENTPMLGDNIADMLVLTAGVEELVTK